MNNQNSLSQIKSLKSKHQSLKQENDRNIGTLEYLESQLKEMGFTFQQAENRTIELNNELEKLDRKKELELEKAEEIISNLGG